MVDDNPQDLVHDLAAEAVFGGHPLGRPVIGRAEVIALRLAAGAAGVPRRRVRRPERRARRRGQRPPRPSRRALRGAPDQPRRPVAGPAAAPRARVPQPGLPLPPQAHRAVPRRARRARASHATTSAATPSSLLDAILGGSASSRLFQEIREKRGMAYSVYSYGSQYAETGQVGIYVGTREDNLAECLDVTAAELAGRRRRATSARASSSGRRRTSRAGCCSRSRARRTA